MKKLCLFLCTTILFCSCTENFSKGERIGLVTKFAQSGLIWKSYEGELHVTQTGMNSTMKDFDFSIDNNKSNQESLISTLDSSAKDGWKIRLIYHQCQNENITGSRGETNYFIDSVQVLDRNINTLFNNTTKTTNSLQGHIIDTIYVIINKSK